MAPEVTFWGTRGSIPTSGPEYAETGGNTACVQISLPDHVILLDAGTGIRLAGEALAHDRRPIILLLSHPHWDHIQGFPFFTPLYQAGRDLTIVAPDHPEWIDMLVGQVDGVRFPVAADFLQCDIHPSADLAEALRGTGVGGTTIATNHPGDGIGYRLEFGDDVLVYLTDNELVPPEAGPTRFEEFGAFVQGAHLLIHDAQYIVDDLPDKAGWGHSTIRQVVRLAETAGVSRLALFHHDPATTDAVLAERAASWQSRLQEEMELLVARDGLSITL
ncbi:MAG: MBL fold metallo-hydrolase [Rhodothermales bacterium]|nr:MBL fold metallo-hydrolase [Rhodothermales bacterium]